ncbi:Anp1-domain-containing protein [Protomyces lactucae-debilis]|uniref:Anp1-domain-containing protein n=1 Tax=Protomyces lactucae-debilis TaxID=2754530 RepID=A0A1Y2EXH9_PROLT|nr:Anp1-domain-containing protein [Protomyces lactucae-debilis]ORY76311.1 Anp1-domain-containing protein [Protomyces lactucae-debilis]
MRPAVQKQLRPITYVLGAIIGLTYLYFFTLTPSKVATSRRAGYTHGSRPLSTTIKRYNLAHVDATADPGAHLERVLILTPMATFLPAYWQNLLALSYPHELIDLGYIVPRGDRYDVMLQDLEKAVRQVQTGPKAQRFGSIEILRQDFETSTGQSEKERHALHAQKQRRAALATARNELLFATLGPRTSWVLHLDSDIVETPKTLIQDLAKHDKDVIVANCYQRYKNDAGEDAIRSYDYNTWHESQTALDLGKTMSEEDLLLEGYAEIPTYRQLMAYEYLPENAPNERVLEVDGVGGTALLVKAHVHRDGAMFPPFSFYHLIETEGFAKMAQRLGYKCWGLPDYLVYHVNE